MTLKEEIDNLLYLIEKANEAETEREAALHLRMVVLSGMEINERRNGDGSVLFTG